MTIYRQGDVLLVRLDPGGSQVREAQRRAENLLAWRRERNPVSTDEEAVLAYGEATGHAHVLHGRATYYLDTGSNGYQVLELLEPAVLKHQTAKGNQADHKPIALPPGWYEFRPQREFTGNPERPRWVSD